MARNSQIEELLTRGVTNVIEIKDLEKKLNSGKKLRIKLGIDPTGPKLHIGRAITLWKLRDFQKLGHKIVFIVGDYTGQIGDASDKTAERQILSLEQIKSNMKTYKDQIGKIIDLKKVEFHYNSDWWGKMTAQEVVKEAMNFTVAQMIERDNFWDRWQAKKPIGLHEILYPLFQGYDSVAVKADVEIGGNDQFFNLLAGRTIQKKYGQKPQNIMTFELLEGTDGRKMSTSYGNCIYIEDAPDDMYGKVMSIKDDLIIHYFILCTDVPITEIERYKKELKKDANPRDIKAKLASAVVQRYYGEESAKKAEMEFDRVFRKKGKLVGEEFKYVPNNLLVDVLIAANFVSSKSEYRRLVEQGGIEIDGCKIGDPIAPIEIYKGMYVQVGKRKALTVK